MKNHVIVEVLEATKTGMKAVEMKGFQFLKTLYAAGSIVTGEGEIQEKSVIKKAGELKADIFEMEEGDIAYGVTLVTGYSEVTKAERTFVVLAKPRAITGLTTEQAGKVKMEELF